MSNTPNISRNDWDASKMYLYGMWQVAANLHDWDINDKELMKVWFDSNFRNNLTGSGRWTKWSFTGEELGTPGSNVTLRGGAAIVAGLYVQVDTPTFLYYDPSLSATNYLIKGTVSTVTTVIAGAGGTFKITDSGKLLSAQYGLEGARLFVNATEFDITSLSGQQIVCTGDSAGLTEDMEYIVLPPKISAIEDDPVSGIPFELLVWLEDVDEVEDPTLLDPITGDAPSHRTQVRWCVYKNYSNLGVGGSTGLPVDPDTRPVSWPSGQFSDAINTHYYLQLFKVDLSVDIVIDGDSSDPTGLQDFSDVGQYFDVGVDTTAGTAANTALSTTLDANATATNDAIDYRIEVGSGDEPGLYATNSNDGTSDATGFSVAKVLSKAIRDKATTPYIEDSTVVAADVPAGSPIDQGYYKIDVNATNDGFDGAVGGVLTYTSASTVSIDDLVALAVYRDGSSFIKRMLPLGYSVEKSGMDWDITEPISGTFEVNINPGFIVIGGVRYQSPLQLTLTNITLTAAHVDATVPTSEWTYLYALQVNASSRELKFLCDRTKPKWNGEHATLVGYCVGIIYFDGTSDPIIANRRGDTIYFKDISKINAFTPVGGDGTGNLLILPPAGATEMAVSVNMTNTASNSVQLELQTGIYTAQIQGEGPIDGELVLPITGETPTYNITGTPTVTTVRYIRLKITEGNFPDTNNWTN